MKHSYHPCLSDILRHEAAAAVLHGEHDPQRIEDVRRARLVYLPAMRHSGERDGVFECRLHGLSQYILARLKKALKHRSHVPSLNGSVMGGPTKTGLRPHSVSCSPNH